MATPVSPQQAVPVATLLIVDDHAAVRAGLRSLVACEPELDVIAAAHDAQTALELVGRHAPDVAVIDFHLPQEDGLSFCLRLEHATARPGRVLYSAFADDLLGVLAVIAGADAVVSKSADPEELVDTLLAVVDGQYSVPRPSPAALSAVSAALEPSDLPVLSMLVHGTSAAEIADTLTMSPEWLQARRWAILRRLTPRRVRRSGLDGARSLLDGHHRSPTR
jgi:DNA-binding NarL/FixJ family response regulator